MEAKLSCESESGAEKKEEEKKEHRVKPGKATVNTTMLK